MFDLQVKRISWALASCLQEFPKTRPVSEIEILDCLNFILPYSGTDIKLSIFSYLYVDEYNERRTTAT